MVNYDKGCIKCCMTWFGRTVVCTLGCVCGLVFGLLLLVAPGALEMFVPLAVAFGLSVAHSDTWVWALLICCRYCWTSRGDKKRDKKRLRDGQEVVDFETLSRFLRGEDIEVSSPVGSVDSNGIALVSVKNPDSVRSNVEIV
jgi:hypothetical protein